MFSLEICKENGYIKAQFYLTTGDGLNDFIALGIFYKLLIPSAITR